MESQWREGRSRLQIFLDYLQSFQKLENLRGSAAERSKRESCADKVEGAPPSCSNGVAICTGKKQNPTAIEDWGGTPSGKITIRTLGES